MVKEMDASSKERSSKNRPEKVDRREKIDRTEMSVTDIGHLHQVTDRPTRYGLL